MNASTLPFPVRALVAFAATAAVLLGLLPTTGAAQAAERAAESDPAAGLVAAGLEAPAHPLFADAAAKPKAKLVDRGNKLLVVSTPFVQGASYEVKVSPRAKVRKKVQVVNDTGQVTLTGLKNGTKYTVRIAVAVGGQRSAWSKPLRAIPAAVPYAPKKFRVTGVTESTVKLGWTRPRGAKGVTKPVKYKVIVAPVGTTKKGKVTVNACRKGKVTKAGQCKRVAKKRAVNLTGLTPGTSYTVTVRARNAKGWGMKSPTLTATPYRPSTPPTDVTATNVTDTNVTLSWGEPADTGGCALIEYVITDQTSGATWTVPAGTTTYTIEGLVPGQTYSLIVQARTTCGLGQASDPVIVTTPGAGTLLPAAPTGLIAQNTGGGTAQLTWSAPASVGSSPITSYTLTQSGSAPIVTGNTATTATVTGLATGTTYTFTVAATNATGTGPASDPATLTPTRAPDAPTGVDAQPASATSIRVSLIPPVKQPGAAVTTYNVQYSTTNDFSGDVASTQFPGDNSTTSLTLTGLNKSVRYWVRVAAGNADGWSPWSPAQAPYPSAVASTTPSAPFGLAALPAGAGGLCLTWSGLDDGGSSVTAWDLDQSPPGGSGPAWDAAHSTVCVSDLTPGTSYTFRVRAQNALGWGPWSDPSTGVPVTVPGAPTGLTGEAASGKAYLEWTAPSDTGFAPPGSLGYQLLGLPPGASALVTGTTAVVTGLTDGQSYTFAVTASTVAGVGPASDPFTLRIDAFPDMPVVTDAQRQASQTVRLFVIPATDPAGVPPVTGWTVAYSTDASLASPTLVDLPGNASTTTLDVPGLTNGTRYYFAAAARNSVGRGPFGPRRPTAPPYPSAIPFTVPDAPTGVTLTNDTAAALGVSWTAPAWNGGDPIVSYAATATLTAAGSATNPSPGGSCTASTTSCSITGLSGTATYAVTVTAVNTAGPGPASTTVSKQVIDVPGKPTGLQSQASDRQVYLDWKAPTFTGGAAITGYRVTASPGGQTVTTSSTVTSVSGLNNGTEYTFSVVAVNKVGASGAATVKDTPQPLPDVIPGVTVKRQASQTLRVSVGVPADPAGDPVTRWTVRYSTSEDLSNPTSLSVDGGAKLGQIDVPGLVNGTEYWVQARAGNTTGWGPWSPLWAAFPHAHPYTTPGTPTALAAQPGDKTVTLTWTAPSNTGGDPITGYQVTVSPNAGTVAVDGTSAVVSGLTNNTRYTFTVVATNAAGTGQASSAASATPNPVPKAPGDLTCNANDTTTVSCSWSATADATSYSVWNGATRLIGPVTGTSGTFAGTAGVAYNLTVTAANDSGTSAPSLVSAVTPLGVAPLTYTANSTTSLSVASTGTTGAASIQYQIDGGAWTTSKTFSSLAANSSHTVTVKAIGQNSYRTGASVTAWTLPDTPATRSYDENTSTVGVLVPAGVTIAWSGGGGIAVSSGAWYDVGGRPADSQSCFQAVNPGGRSAQACAWTAPNAPTLSAFNGRTDYVEGHGLIPGGQVLSDVGTYWTQADGAGNVGLGGLSAQQQVVIRSRRADGLPMSAQASGVWTAPNPPSVWATNFRPDALWSSTGEVRGGLAGNTTYCGFYASSPSGTLSNQACGMTPVALPEPWQLSCWSNRGSGSYTMGVYTFSTNTTQNVTAQTWNAGVSYGAYGLPGQSSGGYAPGLDGTGAAFVSNRYYTFTWGIANESGAWGGGGAGGSTWDRTCKF